MSETPRKRIKIEYDSPVILTLALASLAVLLINSVTGGFLNALLCSVYRTSLRDPLLYARLIFHVIGHVDFAHFFGNMSLLLIIGPVVERRYGSSSVLLAVIFTAVTEGAIHCLVSADTALLGISGVVFMLIFLAAAGDIGDGKLSLTFVLVAIIDFGEALYTGIFAADSISQLCHIVGGVCGIAVAWAISKRKKKK